jgi:sulfite exporter TauE/SafE
MLPEAFQLFLAGFAAAFGPCLITCSPVVVPFIAGTSENLTQSIVRSLFFSLFRLLAFALVGVGTALVGRSLLGLLGRYGPDVTIFMGALIALIGIIILLGKDLSFDICRWLHAETTQGLKGAAVLGVLMGIMPCAARLSVLGYIAVRARTIWQGATLALAFGLGEVWSPVLILAVFSGLLPKIIRTPKAQDILRRASGALILLIGLRLILLPGK